jgi:hypothetical protein
MDRDLEVRVRNDDFTFHRFYYLCIGNLLLIIIYLSLLAHKRCKGKAGFSGSTCNPSYLGVLRFKTSSGKKFKRPPSQ